MYNVSLSTSLKCQWHMKPSHIARPLALSATYPRNVAQLSCVGMHPFRFTPAGGHDTCHEATQAFQAFKDIVQQSSPVDAIVMLLGVFTSKVCTHSSIIVAASVS